MNFEFRISKEELRIESVVPLFILNSKFEIRNSLS